MGAKIELNVDKSKREPMRDITTNADFPLSIGHGLLIPQLGKDTLFLRVADVEGYYTLPYIQSNSTLKVRVVYQYQSCARIRLILNSANSEARYGELSSVIGDIFLFENLGVGDYCLTIKFLDDNAQQLKQYEIKSIGIGLVAMAIGDSLTEGYLGQGFVTGPHRSARDFPDKAVSRDTRNFPQFAPTASTYLPTVNCFKSWMTDLNDFLSESLHQPIFIANEGWGGYTVDKYLSLIRSDEGWQRRVRLLEPNLWLVHLGVNDERCLTDPNKMINSLELIIDHLIDTYGAKPETILIAKPSYDYVPGASTYLFQYSVEIEKLIKQRLLRKGPDFFEAFAKDRQRWYGDDPVHPQQEGMEYMAKLWHEAIIKAIC